MNALFGRLAKLEAFQPMGCRTCASWSSGVTAVLVASANGDPAIEEPRPDACPECGRQAPVWLEGTIELVPRDVLESC